MSSIYLDNSLPLIFRDGRWAIQIQLHFLTVNSFCETNNRYAFKFIMAVMWEQENKRGNGIGNMSGQRKPVELPTILYVKDPCKDGGTLKPFFLSKNMWTLSPRLSKTGDNRHQIKIVLSSGGNCPIITTSRPLCTLWMRMKCTSFTPFSFYFRQLTG